MQYFVWEQTSPEQLLAQKFHISGNFRPGQKEIIEQLVKGQTVLAIQPTSWGKSLCYQMASLYYPHLTIVFSPLKALMRDQYQHCQDLYHIPAAIVSSDFSEEENASTLQRAIEEQIKILYIAPERLGNTQWQNYVIHMRISMIVVDEAHCISTWGHDFRSDYRRIVELLKGFPRRTPILALTATANARVENDIRQQIGSKVQVVRGSLYRSNLRLHALPLAGDQQKLSYLAQLLPNLPGTGIIYAATKIGAEKVATFLQKQGIKAEYYHAGRDNDERQEIEENFMRNQYKVISATNALGMGIDKSDIRFIIHYHIPASPIHYYQEIGRAGRDGKIAVCILLHDSKDLTIQEHFIEEAQPASAQYQYILDVVRANIQGVRESDIKRVTGFKQKHTRTILTDLKEQKYIQQDSKRSLYKPLHNFQPLKFIEKDQVKAIKLQELQTMERYAQSLDCYIHYLTAFLNDPTSYQCGQCGNCKPANFPTIAPSHALQLEVRQFLEEDSLPRIDKRTSKQEPIHEAGYALSYHGTTTIGQLVRASKYENGGPFPKVIVDKAIHVLHKHYPLQEIDAIVSVPPTISGPLVENFARQVATLLKIPYMPALRKIRPTQEQKYLKNRYQKEDNIRGAFTMLESAKLKDRTLLLIDDIYDSGQILQEVCKVLIKAGAKKVYPFTITRTMHSDDQ